MTSSTKIFGLLMILSASAILQSCKKNNDDNEQPDPDKKEAYAVAIRAQGDEGADYITRVSDLMNGEIVIDDKAIEQQGWCYYAGSANAIFSVTYDDPASNRVTAYALNSDGNLYEKGSFAFEALDCMGAGDNNTMIGVGAPWGGGTLNTELMVIDGEQVRISNRRFTTLYSMHPGDTLNKWPTGAVVNAGKVYVAYYPLDGDSWETPETDTAFITVYNYPSLDSVTVIKDDRTGPVGMYGSVPNMFKTETGDIYTFSSNAYAAGYTQVTKPSGILRIKNGETQFDPSFFIDFEAAIGGKISMASYVGNNKALVRYMPSDRDTAVWGMYDLFNALCKMSIVDLAAKTVTPVTGLPDHGAGYGGNVLVENDKAYTPIVSTVTGETRIYEVDPATATAKKGALIKARELPLIYKIHN